MESLEAQAAVHEKTDLQARADFAIDSDKLPAEYSTLATHELLNNQISKNDALNLQHRTDAHMATTGLTEAYLSGIKSEGFDNQNEESRSLQQRTACAEMMDGIAEDYNRTVREDDLELSKSTADKNLLQARTDSALDEELIQAYAQEFTVSIQEAEAQAQDRTLLKLLESFDDSVKDLPLELPEAYAMAAHNDVVEAALAQLDARQLQFRTDRVDIAVTSLKQKAKPLSQEVLEQDIAHKNKRLMLETDKFKDFEEAESLPDNLLSAKADEHDELKPTFGRQISDASTVAPGDGFDRQISDASSVA